MERKRTLCNNCHVNINVYNTINMQNEVNNFHKLDCPTLHGYILFEEGYRVYENDLKMIMLNYPLKSLVTYGGYVYIDERLQPLVALYDAINTPARDLFGYETSLYLLYKLHYILKALDVAEFLDFLSRLESVQLILLQKPAGEYVDTQELDLVISNAFGKTLAELGITP